ncbi:MAG: heme ABC transporter ATP-binding protein [Trueperaceae bacterium]
MIDVKNLNFSYGKKQVLRDVSFVLRPNEILGVVGPNGAGKSTLIKLITKLLEPSSGSTELNGQNLKAISRLELARELAVVPQSGELPSDYRVYDLVMMGRTPHLGFLARESEQGKSIVQRIMQRTDTWQFRDRLANDLSGGERQRVVLARALVQEPCFLLLDEPTNHLDLNYQIEMLSLVRQEVQRSLGALVVLHDLNIASSFCDRLLVMQQGSIVAEGKPQDILTETLVAQVYGARVQVVQNLGSRPVILPSL